MLENFSMLEDMNRLIEMSLEEAVNKAKLLVDADYFEHFEFYRLETIEAVNDATVIGDRDFFKQDINIYLEEKDNIAYTPDTGHVNKKLVNEIIEVTVSYIKKFADTQDFYDFNSVQR